MASRLIAWALTAVLVVSLLPSMGTPIVSAEDGDHQVFLPVILKTPFPIIAIINDQAYEDMFGWKILGEVVNTSGFYMKDPVLALELIQNNQVVETVIITPLLTNFPPNAKICFSAEISSWAADLTYKLSIIEYSVDNSNISKPDVEEAQLIYTPYDPGELIPAYIIGSVANNQSEQITDVWVTGAFFDTNGKVTGCEWDYQIDSLAPTETLPFEIPFYGRFVEDAVNFRVYTDGTVNE